MLPRSLQNFMNAFTSADYTMYPFATTNAQDFKNLMGVYLDATLHPLLSKGDFVQEGWRVGPENPTPAPVDTPNSEPAPPPSDLVFKGVVYNEMKGQMTDTTYLFYIRFQEAIFPSLHNSGGDPAHMTELTHSQLQNFHAAHYHPSNAKIITYGDQPVGSHLKLLGPELDRFDALPHAEDIRLPIALADGGAKTVSVAGPLDPLTPADKQIKTSISWLMGATADINESFALSIAMALLLNGYGSPLYRSLIESGLGTDFTPNTGYDTSARTGIFSVGLNGVSEANLPKINSTIRQTISEVIAKGFEQEKVDGYLHQLELGLKHKTATFGMGIIQRLKPDWFNGIDPFENLQLNRTLEAFKAAYAEPGYLQGLMKKYLDTEDTFTFNMLPSSTYGAELETEEASRLETKITAAQQEFGGEAKAYEHLRERELELVAEQEAGRTQPLDSLPTLRVSDITPQGVRHDIRESTAATDTKVMWRETSTNGLTYFRALALFKDLPDNLRALVPLFCDCLMRIGTREKSMEELEDLIKLKTGGIGFGYHSATAAHDLDVVEEGLSLSGYALDGNVPAMYELFRTLLAETDFEGPKACAMIRQLLQSSASGALDAVASSGHRYAMGFAAAGLTPQGRVQEVTGGLTQVGLISRLAAGGDDTLPNLIASLQRIQAITLDSLRTGRVALTCGSESTAANEAALTHFLQTITTSTTPTNLTTSLNNYTFPSPALTLFPLPTFQTSYTSLLLRTVPYTHSNSPAHAILAQLLTHSLLHPEIREKGGAYGGGALSRGLGGVFGMYSYRDPNPSRAVGIMRGAARFAAEREWEGREIEEAKLGVFQGVDAPRGVEAEVDSRFLMGIDAGMAQRRREGLLGVSREEVREAAEAMRREVEEGGNLVVLGREAEWMGVGNGWTHRSLGVGEAEAGMREVAEAAVVAAGAA